MNYRGLIVNIRVSQINVLFTKTFSTQHNLSLFIHKGNNRHLETNVLPRI